MKQLWKGNYALAEGAIAGGLDAYFGYPITPQNEIPEYMSVRMRQIDRLFLQSESEPASINMVMGASMTGMRAMTSSSSPGISLMTEGISYIAGCELPAVIVNVQRGGPGLGNISGAQGDYFQAVKGGGHGDYRLLVLTPYSVQEMYDMAKKSFDLAFKYRNPVMILADGILGQMQEPATIDLSNISRGISEPGDKGWNLNGAKNRKARFVRSLIMEEGMLEKHNYKLQEKYLRMESELDWEENNVDDADILLIGYGTSARINYDACLRARDQGYKVGTFRLKTAFPFPYKRLRELSGNMKFMVVEMSAGQLLDDVRIAAKQDEEIEFYGIPGGGIPAPEVILEKIKKML